MTWSVPSYTRGRVDTAGKILVDHSANPLQRESAWMIADNWRSSHAYPLNHVVTLLRSHVSNTDPSGIVVQRQKRRESIELKLRDNASMKLSQMQDLGGCRAIVSDVPSVYRIIDRFKASRMKHELVKPFDYITGAEGIRLPWRPSGLPIHQQLREKRNIYGVAHRDPAENGSPARLGNGS